MQHLINYQYLYIIKSWIVNNKRILGENKKNKVQYEIEQRIAF